MVLNEKKCNYCNHPEHAVVPISVTGPRGSLPLQGRICRNCGHCALFYGGSISAYAPNEIKPENLTDKLRNLEVK